MAKYRFVVRTNKVGSECEDVIDIPDQELEGTEEYRNGVLNGYLMDHVSNQTDQFFEKVEDGDDE